MKPVVNAGFDVAFAEDNRYDKAFHHSPGSLTSSVGGSHLLWRPRGSGSLLSASHTSYKPMKEKVIGSLTIQVHYITGIQRNTKNGYIRLGCLLPIGAQSGRWPRYQTKALDKNNENKIIWNEGEKVAIVEYTDKEGEESVILYPQITISLRSKKSGWFGNSSSTLSKICTLDFSKLWNGAGEDWSSILEISLPSKSISVPAFKLFLLLQYNPKPEGENNKAALLRETDELERKLALESTYKSKVQLSPLKKESIELFDNLQEEEIMKIKENSISNDVVEDSIIE